ncbi:18828_t:CDS:2, partial [Dentiscutata erythropus]
KGIGIEVTLKVVEVEIIIECYCGIFKFIKMNIEDTNFNEDALRMITSENKKIM